MIEIQWLDGGSIRTTDIFPDDWFDASRNGAEHDVRAASGEIVKAKCDVKVIGLIADMNYARYPDFNDEHDFLLGTMRVLFADGSRKWISKVQWRDLGAQNFKKCDVDVKAAAQIEGRPRAWCCFERRQSGSLRACCFPARFASM